MSDKANKIENDENTNTHTSSNLLMEARRRLTELSAASVNIG